MTTTNPPQRRFWVVSPNVRDDYHTVGLWRQASVRHRAVFMGYQPGDKGHKQIGYKFAHVIRPNDIVLIARRHHHHPQVVGYGVVVGPYKKALSGVDAPGVVRISPRAFAFQTVKRSTKKYKHDACS
jgi:hypothetical protein